jgi:hypothetical protein
MACRSCCIQCRDDGASDPICFTCVGRQFVSAFASSHYARLLKFRCPVALCVPYVLVATICPHDVLLIFQSLRDLSYRSGLRMCCLSCLSGALSSHTPLDCLVAQSAIDRHRKLARKMGMPCGRQKIAPTAPHACNGAPLHKRTKLAA